MKIISLVFIYLISYSICFSQITWDVTPASFTLECNDDTNNQSIENYLTTISATAIGCGNPAIVYSDYSNPGNFSGGDIITIEITAEDDCGVEPDLIAEIDVTIEDTSEPVVTMDPVELIISCDIQSEMEMLINEWLDVVGNAIYSDDCSDTNDIIVTNDWDNNSICNTTTEITFTIEDESGNIVYTDANIIINSTSVSFSALSYNELEGNVQSDICLSILGEDANNDTTVEITLSNTSSATNGVDHQTISNIQTIIFPAGSSADECFTISMIDDILIEPDETIIFEITSVSGDHNPIIGSINSTTFTILDNDDIDDDGIENTIDNCVANFNPGQEDIDGDGIGDLCDSQNMVDKLSMVKDNIYLDKNYSGVIVKSPNGNCWIIVVHDNGSLQTVDVECPD